MNKTIVLIDNHYWSLNHFRGYLIRYLLEQKCRVIAFTPYPTHFDGTVEGVEYHYTNMKRTSTNILNTINYFIYLYKYISKVKPDLVINFTIKPVLFGSLICRMRSIRCISMFPGLSYLFTSTSTKDSVLKLILKFAIKKCDKILVLNEEDKNILEKGNYVKSEKLKVLVGGEGVDTNLYKLSSQRQFNKTITFIMLSRILKNKGTLDYIEAAKKLSKENVNVKFYLAGGLDETHPEGISKKDLIKLIDNYIEYIGPINVHEWFPKCDCFVLPSYYNEGMNRSIMEAISYQMPVITTDNKGCREMVINNISGYIVPKHDSEKLYEAMKSFYSLNTKSKEEMGKAGRNLAINTFDEKKILKQYKKIFSDICLFH